MPNITIRPGSALIGAALAVAVLFSMGQATLNKDAQVDKQQAQEGLETLHRVGDTMEFESINEGSTLKRQHYAFNDTKMPVVLSAAPMPEVSLGRSLSLRCRGSERLSIEVREPVVTVQVWVLALDVWGKELARLSTTEIRDFDVGTHPLPETAWRIDESGIKYWASAALVYRVRTAAGEVLTADLQAVVRRANEIGARLTADLGDEED